jgi:hypothetical protein
MISNYSFETEMKTHFDKAKNSILNFGFVIPTVFIYSDKGILIMSDFDFSDWYAARQIIRKLIACDKADMVVIASEAWKKNDSGIFPATSKSHQQLICIYGETEKQNMLIVQEFEFAKNKKIVFRNLGIDTNQHSGSLTGFFKPWGRNWSSLTTQGIIK